MAGVKINKAPDELAPTASPRPRRLGWLLEPSYDPEPLRRVGRATWANLTPAALWRRHRLFSLLVLLSIVPRVLAELAFRPAELIPDSFGYMQEGLHLTPLSMLRPAGYPMLLRILEPFHSLVLVTTLQHVMGIAVAAIVYGLLRAKGLPGWGASLAAAPTLFDPRQIWLESAILPDTLFGLAIVVAVAILLTERIPKTWQCALAGLLIAYASVLRGNGAPVIVAVVVFMLVRRVGWRAFGAGLAAFVLPLAAYTGVFHAEYGQWDITNSTGMFLWSRTMSFADCAVIKPPADLKALCPDAQPDHGPAHAAPWSVSAVTDVRSPADYLWASGAWWRHDAHPGINAYNNALAMRFALDAIKAQPLDYVRVTARDVMLTFLATDRSQGILALYFTVRPDLATLSSPYVRYLRDYAHVSSNTRAVQPYAYLLMFYQLPVYFPGWLFFLVLVAGLAGIVRCVWRRRRAGAGPVRWPLLALPWAVAVIIIVVAPALHEYLYRYAISAVPLACLAAGLAFVHRRPQPVLAGPAGPCPPAADAPAVALQAPDAAVARETVEEEGASVEEPATEEPVAAEPAAEEPVTKEPITEEPGTEEPGTAEPVTEEPGTEEPGTAEPVTEEPGMEEPGTAETATEEPGTEEPGTEDADTDPGWPSPWAGQPPWADYNADEPASQQAPTDAGAGAGADG